MILLSICFVHLCVDYSNYMKNFSNGFNVSSFKKLTLCISGEQYTKCVLSVRVLCQGVGNITNIAAKHLSDCPNVVLTALHQSHIQISAAARVPYILTTGGPVRGPDIEIIRLLQRKFGFKYHLKREVNFGIDKMPNGTTFGLLDSVSIP